MRKDLSAIGFGLVFSGLAVLSSFAADPATVTLRGHVPAAVADGRARGIGHVAGDTTLNFSIGLPVRNPNELERTVRQVSDPANPNYGHYLTPQQFTERFGPTKQDYEAVKAFANKSGFTITMEHPNRVLLSVSGRAADVEKAFHVTLNRYQHPTEARDFFAPDREPTIDSSLHVLHIEGLDNFYLPHPNSRVTRVLKAKPGDKGPAAGNAPAGVTPAAGTGPGGTYQGSDFRNAYIPGSSLTGAGQNVGMLQFDAFFTNDIAAYAAQIGLANGPAIVVVPIDGGVPAPVNPTGNQEVSLDIEMILAMSPGVGTIFVYEAPNPSPFPDLLNRMANDDNARQLSSSWGGGPPDPVSEQIFQQMALQGQSFFQASGDSDAIPAGNLVPFPSDSPHITVVGGTTLTTTANQSYTSEAVWNFGIELGIDGVGSSGGISTTYSIPFWQTNINFTLSGGSPAKRNLPDVALTGDNVFIIANGGSLLDEAGTSCAAPLWNGFSALINQQAAALGHPPLGFLNPALYSLATSASNYVNAFHDVTRLNNTWSQSPNEFFAVSNYDLCTGLGTPNGTNLINLLLTQAVPPPPVHISPPPPPYGTTMAAVSGGNPNGTWSVFMQDDAPVNSGFVSNGWILSLTLADIVGTSADLETYLSASSSTVFVGQPISFFLAVTNYGPSISTNVQVVDTLPTSVSVVSTNTTQGTVTRSGSTLTWNVGNLAVGAGAGLTITVQTHSLGTFANSADSQAGTPDPNPDDDLVSTNFSVVTPSVTLIPSFAASSNTFVISVPGPVSPPLTVVIQASTNLVSSNWVNVFTGQPPFIFNYPTANSGNRFFRAQLSP